MSYDGIFCSTVAERPRGADALRYWFRGWTPPTESPIEAALNAGVASVAAAVRDAAGDGDTLELLAALQRYRPVSQKTVYTGLTPGFTEANQAWREAVLAILKPLPNEQLDLLPLELRRLAYRARALEAEPTATLYADHSVTLVRQGSADAWYAVVDGVSTPYFLVTGHLSSRALSVTARRQEAADGTPVISVLVDRARPCGHTAMEACPLPAASECVLTERGPRWAAWRARVYPHEALLPHVGERVRIGDVVLARQNPPRSTEYVDVLGWLRRYRLEIPPYASAPRYAVRTGLDDVVLVYPQGQDAVLSHPDHYPVRVVAPDLEGDWALYASVAAGETQYQRRQSPIGD